MKAKIHITRFKVEEHFERALIAARSEETGAFLDKTFKQRMETCMTRLRETSDRYTQVDKQWRSTAQRRQEVKERLRRTLRDYINVLRRRAVREGDPELVQQYALPKTLVGEKVPWTAYAEKLLEGASQAEAAGFPPVTNPDCAELAARLEEARAVQSELDNVLQTLDAARKENHAAQSDCTFSLRELRIKVWAATQGESAVAQRKLLRSFGFDVDAGRPVEFEQSADENPEVKDQDPFLAPSEH